MLLLAAVAAHLCTLDPLQWGGAYGATTEAAPACFQIDGPCPKTVKPDAIAVAAYRAGSQAIFTLLKDETHYAPTTPGNFSAYLWNAEGTATYLGSSEAGARCCGSGLPLQLVLSSPHSPRYAAPGNVDVLARRAAPCRPRG